MRKGALLIILMVSFILCSVTVVLAGPGEPTVDEGHLILSQGNKGLQVMEFISINNHDTKPYRGKILTDPKGKTGWLIPLPEGFQNLHVNELNKDDYTAVKEGLQVYKALEGGKVTQLSFSYGLPVTSLPASVSKKFGFQTKQFSVITPTDSLSITTNNILKDAGTVNFNNRQYQQYVGTDIQPGTEISFSVDTAKAYNSTGNNRVNAGYTVEFHPQGHVNLFMTEPLVHANPHIWAAYLISMFGLIIAAIILWYKSKIGLTEKQISSTFDEDQEELFLRLNAKKNVLLQRIKTLDKQFTSGGTSEREYQEEREKLKELLVQIKIQLKDLT